jgi:hypothetical protein
MSFDGKPVCMTSESNDVIFREHGIAPACLTPFIFYFLPYINYKICSSIWLK